MALTCNIDARGKLVRLIYGTVVALIGLALAYWWALGTGSPLRWGLCLLCIAAGALGIFEARAGWCVVRAMGFKTPV